MNQAEYLELSYGQVLLAALLIVANGLVSLSLQLRLGRQLLIAAIRTVVQLLLIGFVLQYVFALHKWYVVVGLMVTMTTIAGITAVRRTARQYHGIYYDGLISVGASCWLVMAVALLVIVRIRPWYLPQYSIPLLGMVLGNTLSGVSLGLDRLLEQCVTGRNRIEAMLSLGATRWEAARGPMQEAVRTGMIPIINSMMVVGLVSLPGMMTGQLLAGVAPLEAVKYQIVIMFLIASATGLGSMGAVLLGYRRLFNARHQFLNESIKDRATP